MLCRVCLVMNVRMYNILQTSWISSAYIELTGITQFGLNEHICYECATRLRKCQEFRSNCFKAHQILALKGTTVDLQKDRKLNCLESPLQLSNIIICEYNNTEKPIDSGILNFENINIGSDYGQSYSKNLKYDFLEKETEFNSNKISCLFDNQNTLACDSGLKEVDNISGIYENQTSFACGSTHIAATTSGELDNLNSLPYESRPKDLNTISDVYDNQNFLTYGSKLKEVHTVADEYDHQNLLPYSSRPKVEAFFLEIPYTSCNNDKDEVICNHNKEMENNKQDCQDSKKRREKRKATPRETPKKVMKKIKTIDSNDDKLNSTFLSPPNQTFQFDNSAAEFVHQNSLRCSIPRVEEVYLEIKTIPSYNDKNIVTCNSSMQIEEKESNLQEVKTKPEKLKLISSDKPKKLGRKLNTPEDCYADGIPTTFINPPDRFSKLDAKVFEEFAVVIPMTFEDAKKEVELRKESSNYKKSPHKCDLCCSGYGSQRAYNNHMKKHSLTEGEFKCDVCHLRFPILKRYNAHMISSHRRKFRCKLCPYTCFSIAHVKVHIQLHKGSGQRKTQTSEPDGIPSMFKAPPDKHSQFDAKAFEEYAVVTPMTFEDAKREVESRKESSNYKRCPLKCNLCYRGYGTQSAYNNHMKKHSLAKGKHECEVCHLRFPKLKPYSKHMVSCHKRKFSCKLCPYTCFSITQVKGHIKFHKGVNYACDICQEIFSMPNTMLSHKRMKHPTEVVCALCGSAFATDKGLNSHIAMIHIQETNDKKGPQCAECNVHFATELAWKRHLVLSAKHKVSFGCETCGQAFASASMLKTHIKLHASEQKPRLERYFPADCSFCSKTLTNRVAYKEHMTQQHPDSDVAKWLLADEYLPCVCEFCGKAFKTPSLMATHQTKHTGERPYKCNVCERAFSVPATLSAHKKTHIPDSRVKCDICFKIFQTKSALKKHERISHLNIRPFSCSDCGKSYHNLCEVKYHKQHAHGNMPWPNRKRNKQTKQSD